MLEAAAGRRAPPPVPAAGMPVLARPCSASSLSLQLSRPVHAGCRLPMRLQRWDPRSPSLSPPDSLVEEGASGEDGRLVRPARLLPTRLVLEPRGRIQRLQGRRGSRSQGSWGLGRGWSGLRRRCPPRTRPPCRHVAGMHAPSPAGPSSCTKPRRRRRQHHPFNNTTHLDVVLHVRGDLGGVVLLDQAPDVVLHVAALKVTVDLRACEGGEEGDEGAVRMRGRAGGGCEEGSRQQAAAAQRAARTGFASLLTTWRKWSAGFLLAGTPRLACSKKSNARSAAPK